MLDDKSVQRKDKEFPMQPVEMDANGALRFVANPLVAYLLDNGGIDMNELTRQSHIQGWSDAAREQFAQLIGYSVAGFSTLSYVRPETLKKVLDEAKDNESKPALEQNLENIKKDFERRLVNAVFTARRLKDNYPTLINEGLYDCLGMFPDDDHVTKYCAMITPPAWLEKRVDSADVNSMRPTLDLLLVLPDVIDRRVLFWAAWHQEGELKSTIPWAKVRRSMGAELSQSDLNTRYDSGLDAIAKEVALLNKGEAE